MLCLTALGFSCATLQVQTPVPLDFQSKWGPYSSAVQYRPGPFELTATSIVFQSHEQRIRSAVMHAPHAVTLMLHPHASAEWAKIVIGRESLAADQVSRWLWVEFYAPGRDHYSVSGAYFQYGRE